MTAVALVVVLWLAVLVPQAVKSQKERRREFMDSFERGLGTLGAARPAGGANTIDGPPPGPPTRRRASAAKRRRTILALLLASTVVSVVPAVVGGGKAALAVHLVVDNVLLVYVGLLVRRGDARSAAAALPVPAPPPGATLEAWDEEALVVPAPPVRAAFRVG